MNGERYIEHRLNVLILFPSSQSRPAVQNIVLQGYGKHTCNITKIYFISLYIYGHYKVEVTRALCCRQIDKRSLQGNKKRNRFAICNLHLQSVWFCTSAPLSKPWFFYKMVTRNCCAMCGERRHLISLKHLSTSTTSDRTRFTPNQHSGY